MKIEGLWPGVAAITGDADIYCLICAKKQYGEAAVDAVVWSEEGYEQHVDREGNGLYAVLSDSEDLCDCSCGNCFCSLGSEYLVIKEVDLWIIRKRGNTSKLFY